MISHRRYLGITGALFAAVWIALAINPQYRADWALENVAVIIFALPLRRPIADSYSPGFPTH
jgi:putative membrane protein